MPDPLEAQSPRLEVIWACPNCAAQNRTPFGADKIECKNCYQRVIIDLLSADLGVSILRMAGKI